MKGTAPGKDGSGKIGERDRRYEQEDGPAHRVGLPEERADQTSDYQHSLQALNQAVCAGIMGRKPGKEARKLEYSDHHADQEDQVCRFIGTHRTGPHKSMQVTFIVRDKECAQTHISGKGADQGPAHQPPHHDGYNHQREHRAVYSPVEAGLLHMRGAHPLRRCKGQRHPAPG